MRVSPSGRLVSVMLLLIAALVTLPSSAASAYSGQQTLRDEHDGCCYHDTGTWYTYSGWNGYDYDGREGSADNSQNAYWYPYPNPPAVECIVIHIPNSQYAFGEVAYGFDDTYGITFLYQQYDHGYWINFLKASTSSSDYVWLDGQQSAEETIATDVVSFHWNSSNGYTDCSF